MTAKPRLLIPAGLMLATLLFLTFPLPISFRLAADSQEAPLWWEIALNLKSDGEYTLEDEDGACRGRFRFSLRWTGWMERDDEDYLLYRFNCEVSGWEAEEARTAGGVTTVLRTPDFPEKPSLDLKYILRRGGSLHLNLIVKGINVPPSEKENRRPLLFPSSEENDQRTDQLAYNSGIVKGSNRVALEEKTIYAAPTARTFAWDWKCRQRLSGEHTAGFGSQSHRVEVSLSIIPRYGPPKFPLR